MDWLHFFQILNFFSINLFRPIATVSGNGTLQVIDFYTCKVA